MLQTPALAGLVPGRFDVADTFSAIGADL